MVARGDLGVEVPFEVLPRIQRRIIRHLRRDGETCHCGNPYAGIHD